MHRFKVAWPNSLENWPDKNRFNKDKSLQKQTAIKH